MLRDKMQRDSLLTIFRRWGFGFLLNPPKMFESILYVRYPLENLKFTYFAEVFPPPKKVTDHSQNTASIKKQKHP